MRAKWMMLATATVPGVALAQRTPPPAAAPAPAQADEAANGDDADIVVTASRTLPGAVVGDIAPEEQLGPSAIRSYGVSSVADLLTELSPQTRSDRGGGGAPVVLLDGRRISSFAEIRDLPTEAIARVDILPEEVALKYGYRADQRVVNFVLRRRFRAVTAEAADRIATEGGRNAPQGDLDLLGITNGRRVNLHVKYQSANALTEAQRSIAPAAGATLDQRPYRTLLPATQNFSANAIYARTILGNVGATLNGRVETTASNGIFGLPTVFDASGAALTLAPGFLPLGQRQSLIAGHLGTTYNGDVGKWRWSLTGNYDRTDSETFTDRGLTLTNAGANPLAVGPVDVAGLSGNRGRSLSSVAGADLLVNGTLFSLPAGPVATSVRVGGEINGFTSRTYRADLTQTGRVQRDTVNGQVNIDVPLTSRGKDVLAWAGDLSVNGNLAVDQLSDFGTLTTIGYGANWQPIDGVRFLASHTQQDEAPSPTQLGAPVITTPNARVFDYQRGTTATVSVVTGGNPLLVADNRRVTKLELTLKPWHARDLTLSANYVSSRTDNPIQAFPVATAAIETAFANRFTRDAGGQLVAIDERPINFANSRRSELRWGINFSAPLKSKIQREIEAFRAGKGPNPFAGLRPPGGQSGGQPSGRPGGEGAGRPGGFGSGGFGGRGGGGRGQFGGGGGRVQFALYHTWHFTDRVLVRAGGPDLDLLRGDAIGGTGGQPRHELEGQAGYSNNGLGARTSVNFASATQVNGGTGGPLSFGSLTTANVRLFADLGQRLELVKAHPWVRGLRLTLSVDNLFDQRQRVTDGSGVVPVSYQGDYLDPIGRTVRLSIRKLFF